MGRIYFTASHATNDFLNTRIGTQQEAAEALKNKIIQYAEEDRLNEIDISQYGKTYNKDFGYYQKRLLNIPTEVIEKYKNHFGSSKMASRAYQIVMEKLLEEIIDPRK